MKRVMLGLVVLLVSMGAFAQDMPAMDVSSQPVPGLIGPYDISSSIETGVGNDSYPLAVPVQNCYRLIGRQQIGTTSFAEQVMTCAELDIVGMVLNQMAQASGARQDPYFDGTANRVGTELIAYAGLNTMQAYQTFHWLKATMAPLVKEAATKAGRNSTYPPGQS